MHKNTGGSVIFGNVAIFQCLCYQRHFLQKKNKLYANTLVYNVLKDFLQGIYVCMYIFR